MTFHFPVNNARVVIATIVKIFRVVEISGVRYHFYMVNGYYCVVVS
jgi:hypothetical protein